MKYMNDLNYVKGLQDATTEELLHSLDVIQRIINRMFENSQYSDIKEYAIITSQRFAIELGQD